MKTLFLDNIEDPDAQLEDLIGLVKHTLLERGPEIMFDEETDELYPDWVLRMNEFIDSDF